MHCAISRPLCKGDAPSFRLRSGICPSSSAVPPSTFALPLLRSSSSFFSGSSSYSLQPRHLSRVLRTTQVAERPLIKAAFIFEWIGNLFKYLSKTPAKLYAQKVEADLHRASKMIKTGALLVAKVAKEADEFAEEVEQIAERTEKLADKVVQDTETLEERIDEVLDVIEGEKKLVITSYKLVGNEGEATMRSTTVSKDGNQTTISVENHWQVNPTNNERTD